MGSEMCIRDRASPGSGSRSSSPRRRARQQRRDRHPVRRRRPDSGDPPVDQEARKSADDELRVRMGAVRSHSRQQLPQPRRRLQGGPGARPDSRPSKVRVHRFRGSWESGLLLQKTQTPLQTPKHGPSVQLVTWGWRANLLVNKFISNNFIRCFSSLHMNQFLLKKLYYIWLSHGPRVNLRLYISFSHGPSLEIGA